MEPPDDVKKNKKRVCNYFFHCFIKSHSIPQLACIFKTSFPQLNIFVRNKKKRAPRIQHPAHR